MPEPVEQCTSAIDMPPGTLIRPSGGRRDLRGRLATCGLMVLSTTSCSPPPASDHTTLDGGSASDGGSVPDSGSTPDGSSPDLLTYSDGLFKPENLMILAIRRTDPVRAPAIGIADSTHRGGRPRDGLPLAGGGAFKANPDAGGNLFFRHAGGNWLGRGRNGSTIAAALRDNRMFGGKYNPTQGGFKDICGALTEVSPREAGSSFGGARIDIGRFRFVFADQWNHGLDITRDESECQDARRDDRPDQGGEPDHGDSDNDQLDDDEEAVAGLVDQAHEASSELDFDGFYEDAAALVASGGLRAVSVLRRVQVVTFEREAAAMRQFRIEGPVGEDLRPDVPGDQAGGELDLSDFGMANNTRIGRDQAELTFVWYEAPDGQLERLDLPADCTEKNCEGDGDRCKCNFEVPEKGICLMTGAEHRNAIGFGDESSCDPEAAITMFPLIIIGTEREVSAGQAIGLYYPFHSWANRQQIKCLGADGAIVYEEDRRQTVGLRALFEGRPGGEYDVEDEGGVHLEFWQQFTNIGLQTDLAGLLNPASEHGPLPGGCKESLWGEMFYLLGTPADVVDAAHEIHRNVNNPAAGWVSGTYDLEP